MPPKVVRTTVYIDRATHKRVRLVLLRKGLTLSGWLRRKIDELLTEG